MNTDILSGNWKQLRGAVQETWGRLTDDDLDWIDGRTERWVGVMQERYGWEKERAEKEIDGYLKNHEDSDEQAQVGAQRWPCILLLSVAILAAACAPADPVVTASVKTRLAADDLVKARQIEVTTEDNVVTLTGIVDSQEEKDRAVSVARGTAGVADVEDRIAVRTSDTTADAPDSDRTVRQVVDDAGITAAVKGRLLEDPTVRGLRIDVDTREGIVYLTGTVASEKERDRAVEIARATQNVKDVQVSLRVERG